MKGADMNKDSKPGVLRSTGKNGEKRNASELNGIKNSRNNLKVFLLIFAFIVAFVAAYFFLVADLPGYCKEQNRYIGDEEFIKAAILITRSDIEKTQPWSRGKGSGSFYGDWNGYVPDLSDMACCKVKRENTRSILNRLLRQQSVEVWVTAPRREGQLAPPNIIKFYFDVCGKLEESDIGVRWHKYSPITTTTVLGE